MIGIECKHELFVCDVDKSSWFGDAGMLALDAQDYVDNGDVFTTVALTWTRFKLNVVRVSIGMMWSIKTLCGIRNL